MLPFELTKDTPYLALSGELWRVFMSTSTEIDRVIKGFYCNYLSMLGLNLIYVSKRGPRCLSSWLCQISSFGNIDFIEITTVSDKNTPVAHISYHSLKWLGDMMNQGISSHYIDLDCSKYLIAYIRKVNIDDLTHWGHNKMAAIFQTTFSKAFSWMKIY